MLIFLHQYTALFASSISIELQNMSRSAKLYPLFSYFILLLMFVKGTPIFFILKYPLKLGSSSSCIFLLCSGVNPSSTGAPPPAAPASYPSDISGFASDSIPGRLIIHGAFPFDTLKVFAFALTGGFGIETVDFGGGGTYPDGLKVAGIAEGIGFATFFSSANPSASRFFFSAAILSIYAIL